MSNDSAFLSGLVRDVPTDALTDHLIRARETARKLPVLKTGRVTAVNDDGTINVDVPAVDDFGNVIDAPILGVRIIGNDVPSVNDMVQLLDTSNGQITYQGRVRIDSVGGPGGGSGGDDYDVAFGL